MKDSSVANQGFSGFQVFLMITLAMILTVAITSWLLLSDIFVTEFKPVKLSTAEETVLTHKLHVLGVVVEPDKTNNEVVLEPEVYSEVSANREIRFSEKELNAILAKNTDLASKLAVDLSDDLMSVKLLLPLDEELPFLGGNTLKVTAGVKLEFVENQPVVIVKGVSIWGVPVPAAYLGDVKNMDLIKEFGDAGFWKSFAEGLDNLVVTDGNILIHVSD